MDANNLLVNMVSNNLQISGKQNTKIRNEQNSFLNLLNMVMQNKIDTSETAEVEPSNANIDIINMLLNINSNNQISIMDSNNSNANVISLVQTDNQSDKESKSSETNYNNLIGMLLNITQNIPITEIKKMNSEEFMEDSIQGINIQQASNIVNLMYSRNVENNSNNNKKFNGIPTDLTNNAIEKLIVNNDFSKNVSTSKEGTRINQEIDGSVQIVQMVSKIESGDFTSNIKSKLNSVKDEAMIKNDIVKNKSKVDVDYNKSIVDNKNYMFSNNNKIVEISDESSKIKTTVLSQVEDKVILMANSKNGKQEVNMELNPQNLGKVNIKMSISSDKITVEIMALNGKTSDILLANVQELTKVLQNNFNDGTVNVIVAENSLDQYNQSNLNYNQQQNNKEQSYKNQFFNNEIIDVNEDNKITEMINLRNLKLNKVV